MESGRVKKQKRNERQRTTTNDNKQTNDKPMLNLLKRTVDFHSPLAGQSRQKEQLGLNVFDIFFGASISFIKLKTISRTGKSKVDLFCSLPKGLSAGQVTGLVSGLIIGVGGSGFLASPIAYAQTPQPMTFEEIQQYQQQLSDQRQQQLDRSRNQLRMGGPDSFNAPSGQAGYGGTPQANPSNGTGQGQRQAAAPMALPPIDVPKQSYNEAQQGVLPMSPAEIVRFKKHLEESRKAERPVVESKPVTGSITLDLQPGSAPPAVRVAVFHGATLNFLDASGRPWPVLAVTNFNKEDFEVAIPFADSPTITVSNLGYYGTGNLAVFLKDLHTPITVALYGNQKETDYRMDFRLLARAPGSADPIPSSGLNTSARLDPRILRFVDGIPPEGGKRVHTDEPLIKAYQVDNKLVIRTQLTLLSAFDAKVPGYDGTAVYVLPITPVASVSENGSPRRVFFKF